MKTYVTPQLTLLAFVADQTIAAAASATTKGAANGSNIFNDVEFAW